MGRVGQGRDGVWGVDGAVVGRSLPFHPYPVAMPNHILSSYLKIVLSIEQFVLKLYLYPLILFIT